MEQNKLLYITAATATVASLVAYKLWCRLDRVEHALHTLSQVTNQTMTQLREEVNYVAAITQVKGADGDDHEGVKDLGRMKELLKEHSEMIQAQTESIEKLGNFATNQLQENKRLEKVAKGLDEPYSEPDDRLGVEMVRIQH